MNKNSVPDFLTNSNVDNIYRTKNYIVTQSLGLQHDQVENNIVISYDTYYKRTRLRDQQYELLFSDKVHINGKRLPSVTYTRKYID